MAAAAAALPGGVARVGRQPAESPPDRFHKVPCPKPPLPDTKRKQLVFAAVGDSWTPSKWSFSANASWDLVAVYYGNDSNWSCAQCKLALRMPNSFKWQMLWALMSEAQPQWRGIWQAWRRQYSYIMVADDDLTMDSCTIDVLFQTMQRRKLLAAQPSNCRGNDSDNPYWVHWQLPGLELHYVNVVEVTAPAFDVPYLHNKVRPLLKHTYSGWGLPFCFGATLDWAGHKLAAVDSVCMIHPTRRDVGRQMSVGERIRRGLVKPGSIYSRFGELTPYSGPIQEQQVVWQMCGYVQSRAVEHGQAYPPAQQITGALLAPGSGVEWPIEAPAASAAPVQQQGLAQQREQRHREVAGLPGARLLGVPLLMLAQLGLAAVAGAVAAIQWERGRKQ